MSLRTRVALIAAAAVAVALIAAFFGLYVVTERTLVQAIDTDLRRIAAEIPFLEDRTATPRLPRRGDFGPRSARFGGAGGTTQAVLADGTVLSRTGEGLPVTDAALAIANGRGEAVFETVQVAGVRVRVLTLPTRVDAAVQVARPLGDVDTSLSELRRRLGLFGILGVGVAGLLGLTVARRAVRPVEELTGVVEEVAATADLTRRIEVAGTDEIARLAQTFNAMLASLEEARSAQEQLVADASHELRTPLTSLRTNIEVLADADRLDEGDRRALIGDVVAQIDEFAVLITGLVELARGGAAGAQFVEVRLDALVGRVVERARTFAPSGLEITLTAEPTTVVVDAERVERAVSNMLDNAVKYGGVAGPVEVRVVPGTVSVRDHGPGIADEDLDKVFDRFYRAVTARSAPGSGLGLSIVRQVAEAHDGHAEVRNAPGGGAIVALHLPQSGGPGAS